jgi:hypothetical protein
VLVTGPGPYYAPLADLDRERAHHGFDAHLWLAVAALAVHIMANTALTGGTYDIYGGQQLISS